MESTNKSENITIKKLEEHYNFNYPEFFKKLWDDGMLDWFRGWDEPWTHHKNWETEIYPQLKENPPILLHSANDFEMLQYADMLNYEFCDWWDIEKHKFVPFGASGAGDMYAFYKNIEVDGEHPIVMVWHDNNETEILAKNLEDFIFRQMLEKCFYVENEEKVENMFRDLKSITPYLKNEYVELLNEVYSKELKDNRLLSEEECASIAKKYLDFEFYNDVFDHEIKE